MAESSLFVLLIGILLIIAISVFKITWINPEIVTVILFLLLIPGFYGAFTSGPFVPSARKRHKTMLSLAKITQEEVVYDLGCGDGRLVFSASKQAKKAIGYDLSIPLVLYGKLVSLFYPKAEIKLGNIWKQDYQKANVIFCYLLPKAMKQFYKEVWPKLTPGTRVVSNSFTIHELKPDKEEDKVYLYLKK